MPKVLFYSLLISLILGAFNRFQITNSIAINFSDIVASIFLLYSLIKYQPLKQKFLNTYFIWVTAIFIVFILSLVPHITSTPLSELAVGVLYPIRYYIYFLLPLSLVPFYTHNKISKDHISITFLIISLIGLAQFAIIPNLQFLEQYGYDPHYYRLVSTWLDPNFLGAALVIALLITYRNFQKKPTNIFMLVIIFVSLVLTFSRSAYIMFAVAFALYSLFTRSVRTFILLGLALAIISSIYLFPRTSIDTSRNIDRGFSANLRLMSYGLATQIFLEHPFTGAGYNLIRYEKRQMGKILDVRDGGNSGAGIDSSWLLIIATTGIFGTLAFLSFWIRLAYFSIDQSMVKSKPFLVLNQFLANPDKDQSLLISILVAWSVHAWFINSLFYIPLIILWTLVFSKTIAKDLTK
jgi:hypothetical protein